MHWFAGFSVPRARWAGVAFGAALLTAAGDWNITITFWINISTHESRTFAGIFRLTGVIEKRYWHCGDLACVCGGCASPHGRPSLSRWRSLVVTRPFCVGTVRLGKAGW